MRKFFFAAIALTIAGAAVWAQSATKSGSATANSAAIDIHALQSSAKNLSDNDRSRSDLI